MKVSAQRCFQFEQWATEVVNVVREGGGGQEGGWGRANPTLSLALHPPPPSPLPASSSQIRGQPMQEYLAVATFLSKWVVWIPIYNYSYRKFIYVSILKLRR